MKKISKIKLNINGKKAQSTEWAIWSAFVILILSFIIILLFWSGFNFEGNIDRQTCYTSVVLRGSASVPIIKTEFRETIPLKCKTDNFCITSTVLGSECPSLGKTYTKVNVGTSKDKILKTIAQNIYDWHKTMGEGKINFMPHDFIGKSNYCFLNSLISFDANTQEEIKKNNIEITYFDIYTKLAQMKTDEGTSYFAELFGTSAQINNLGALSLLKIDPSKNYMIVTKITEKSRWMSQISTAFVGGAVAGGIVAFSVATAGTGPLIIAVISAIPAAATGGTLAGAATHYFVASDPNAKTEYEYSAPALYVYDKEALINLNCDSFENRPATAGETVS